MLASLAGEGEGEGSFTLFSVLVQPQAAQTWGEDADARGCVFVKTPDRVRFVACQSNCHCDHSTSRRRFACCEMLRPFWSQAWNCSRLKKMSLLLGIADSAILTKHLCNAGNWSRNGLVEKLVASEYFGGNYRRLTGGVLPTEFPAFSFF